MTYFGKFQHDRLVMDQAIATTCGELNLQVSPPGLYVLYALGTEATPAMPSALARYAGYPATSFTPVLDRLEDSGLIRREANKADRRAVTIHLTDKARALMPKVMEAVADIEATVFACWYEATAEVHA